MPKTYAWTLECNASTTTSFKKYPMPGRVRSAKIIFPDGCAATDGSGNLATLRIMIQGMQLAPSDVGTSFTGNNEEIIIHALEGHGIKEGEEWEIIVVNSDTDYTHRPILRVDVA